MKLKYKYTIAIPVYNGSITIENAIESALTQSYSGDYETIVVDNCSIDGTYDKVKEINGSIKLFRNCHKVSMYENHNICLNKARGEYVVFCHADDILYESAIETLDKQLSSQNYPEKIVIWGRSHFRDFGDFFIQSGGVLNGTLCGLEGVKPFLYAGLTPSGTCYSRTSFLNLGGFVMCNHVLAPSDMTTMIYLATNGFEFKMIDYYLFDRRHASTAKENLKRMDYMTSKVDAFFELEKLIGRERINTLLDISETLTIPPVSFFFACVKNKFHSIKAKKILFKKCLRKPKLLSRRDVLRVFLSK